MSLFSKLKGLIGGNSGVEYSSFGIGKLTKLFHSSIPKEFIPTNRTGSILGIVYLLVVVRSIFEFPVSEFLGGNLEVAVEVGWPWPFLIFDLLNPTASPIQVKEFIWSIFLYTFISYIIEVIINYIAKISVFKSKKDKNLKPRFFKDIKETMAEKFTRKFVEKKEELKKIVKSSPKKVSPKPASIPAKPSLPMNPAPAPKKPAIPKPLQRIQQKPEETPTQSSQAEKLRKKAAPPQEEIPKYENE